MAGHRPPKPSTLKSSRPSAKEVSVNFHSGTEITAKVKPTIFESITARFLGAFVSFTGFYLLTGGAVHLWLVVTVSLIAAVMASFSSLVYLLDEKENSDPVEEWLEKNDDPLWLINIKEMFMQDKIDVQRLERLTALGWAGRLTDNGMRKRVQSIVFNGSEFIERISPRSSTIIKDNTFVRSNSYHYMDTEGEVQLRSARKQLDDWSKKPMAKCNECDSPTCHACDSQRFEREFARAQQSIAAVTSGMAKQFIAMNENNYKPSIYISPKEYHQSFDPFRIPGKGGLG